MKHTLLIAAAALLLSTPSTAQDFETATEAVANMGVGWNLGNTFDSHNGQRTTDVTKSETMWGQPVTKAELMAMMKRGGFGAIRLPVTWYPHMDSNGKVDAQWMKRVHEVVDYIVDQGLYCILNIHHDTGADNDGNSSWLKADMDVYNAVKQKYEYLWQQIATEFRDYDERLLFESYNEMLDTYNSWNFASYSSSNRWDATKAASAYEAINAYAQSFVDVVRSTGGNNARRNLVVNTYGACNGSGTWNTHLQDPLKQMKLPTDNTPGHLIFQVHAYPNIDVLANAKSEVTRMIDYLKTYLVAQGAPVIIGEWGTGDTGNDYLNHRARLLAFAQFFVQTAKANGMGTFKWMGISDGTSRSLPAFSQPDLAETIVKAYHGDDFQGVYPTEDDYNIIYTVNYTGSWQEMNIYSGTLNVSDYSGIRLVLKQAPPSGTLSAKFYGASNNSTQGITAASTLLKLPTNLGSTLSRVTMQYNKSGNYSATIVRIALVKKDGTEIEVKPTAFWGCTVSVEAELKPSGIDVATVSPEPADDRIYSLTGQRLSTAPRRGIIIRNGRKVFVR